jgi:hypothetical protein
MVLSQREAFISQEWCRIDQLPRVDSRRYAKESIHDIQPRPSTESSDPFGRDAKIREQPIGIPGRGLRQLPNDGGQLRVSETIEKKMRYKQIVMKFGGSPRGEVSVEKTNAVCALGPFELKTLPRQSQHALARVDAIDLNSWMEPQQFAKKSSVPLPYD